MDKHREESQQHSGYGTYVPNGSVIPVTDNTTLENTDTLRSSSALFTSEQTPLIGSHKVIIYRRRWYILFILSMIGFIQNLVWNTWGPITDSARLVFKWSNADIAMFANAGNIFYVILAFPSSWILDMLGLRVAYIICITLNVIATLLRCISSQPTAMYWACNVAAVLGGAAGPIISASPALFSAHWFPADQRVMSTSIANMMTFGGIAASMLIGPQMVQYVNPFPNNHTHNHTDEFPDYSLYSSSLEEMYEVMHHHHHHNRTSNPIISKQRDQIMHYMYFECALCGLFFLLTVLYFPAKPPTPPSTSAAAPRDDFRWGLKKLFWSPQFWLIMLASGIPGGVVGSWCNILDISLQKVNIDQTVAGYMGAAQISAAVILGISVSIFAAKFARHMKLIIIVMSLSAGFAFTWVLLLRDGYIEYSLAQMYAAVIISGALITAVNPLFFELASERFYPIAEGIIGGYLCFCYNLCSTLFLFLFYIPNIGDNFIIPGMLVASLTSVPLMLGLRESYGRLAVDAADRSTDTPESAGRPSSPEAC